MAIVCLCVLTDLFVRICGRTDPFMAVSFTQHLFPTGTIAVTALPMTPDTSPFPVSKSGIRFLPANSVPAALPATISQSASGRAPLVMMVSIPAPSPAGPPAISSSSRPGRAASRHPPPSHTRHRRCNRSGKAAALRDADADRCHTAHRYRKKSPAGSPCARKNRSARRPDISAPPHLKQAAGIA